MASQGILVADGHLSAMVTTRVLCRSISVTSEEGDVGLVVCSFRTSCSLSLDFPSYQSFGH